MGIPPDVSGTFDRRTGLADGLVVPEADRDANKDPIYYVKKNSIYAIPVMHEDGSPVVASAAATDRNDSDKKQQPEKMYE